MTDQRVLYRYWRAELATPGSQSRDTADGYTDGFWRAQAAKTKTDYPVAIWHDGDDEQIKVGRKQFAGNMPEGNDFRDGTWQHCAAVTKEVYDAAVETGFWPDGKAARKMSDEEKMGIEIPSGDNAAPPAEALDDQIAALADNLNKTPEPATQDEANKLSGLLDKMRALLKLAKIEFEAEKQPFLEGGRLVDAKWRIIREPGEQAGIDAEARRKAFLLKEQQRLDAEAEELRKQQQAEIDAQQAAAAAEAADKGEPVPAAVPAAIIAPPAAAPRATAGSAFGRQSGLRKVAVLDTLDVEALAFHFLETKDTDFVAYLTERARKAIRAKVTLPGVKTKDDYQ